MKIFATSDIHGNMIIIDKFKEVEEIADLLLVCGDVSGKYNEVHDLQQLSIYQKEDADYFSNTLSNLKIDSRFILGNDDWFEYEHKLYLSKQEKINKIDFIPFEYVSITPFSTNREINENMLSYELHKLKTDSNTIIVAHTPPLAAGDILYSGQHTGSKKIKNWIEKIQPKAWLCGHIHENNSVTKINNTLVFNCACMHPDNILRGWLIDTDTMHYEDIEI